ncbi:MAG: 30S ribosomal protein S18 [Candidatus Buchananbacteria bacterium RBG_13_39_9]|jgi:small subunit ribosomal protein S18|uniref:Small ribosomal subunit protein bS18 n=1 Tax=Candidatus Buchananbacteria bacterium RBG_13_39_9 TaxID=1797531 RepID=A0A1G1XT12_9BACT|nr:MAG: 30S ribosomal protein S18 [Candidatus Buchananbacteria bacterium RBG_13_39_9]
MPKQKNLLESKKFCYFCQNGIKDIDYKDGQLLRRWTSSYGKIVPRRRSGVCSKHQRKVAQAIKRARYMAILPYLPR